MTFDEMMAELRAEYIESLPGKIQNLEQCWSAKNLPELQDSFHKMKGTGKTYGLPEVSQLAEIMEKICKQKPQALEAAVPVGIALFREIHKARAAGSVFDITKDSRFTAL